MRLTGPFFTESDRGQSPGAVLTFCSDKRNFSKATKEFIVARLLSTEHIENVEKLMEDEVKSLKVKEANSLLIQILTQMVINNGDEVFYLGTF